MSIDRTAGHFSAIDAARSHDPAARVPLWLDGLRVGSVARACLPVLAVEAPWLTVNEQGVTTALTGAARDAAFADTHAALRAQGLVTGWRDELFAVLTPNAHEPHDFKAPPLARIERAAARFWGTLTFGAHANGYLADDTNRPAQMWIAQRSLTKATDPGCFDNLVGGGVPAGQTPFEALVREGWEEAGLDARVMQRATPGRTVDLLRALPDCAGHGLQWERLHVYDLRLHPHELPRNQDGEVAALALLPIDEALQLAATGQMTVDAALATLDFALRHRLLPADEARALAQRAAPLVGKPASMG